MNRIAEVQGLIRGVMDSDGFIWWLKVVLVCVAIAVVFMIIDIITEGSSLKDLGPLVWLGLVGFGVLACKANEEDGWIFYLILVGSLGVKFIILESIWSWLMETRFMEKRIERVSKHILDAVENDTFSEACEIAAKEYWESGSIKKRQIQSMMQRLIQQENDCDQLYNAFKMMRSNLKNYHWIDQDIGHKLYDLGDGRIEKVEPDEAPSYYTLKPTGPTEVEKLTAEVVKWTDELRKIPKI